ncbi:MAG: SurA N-terminal domain-containing protein [Desulfobulbaceae bacterium]|nr:SurA N-terminal domain-containing protein [Desulfobulbaceae bacterium]
MILCKRTIAAFAILLTLAVVTHADVVDRVVAIVNDEVITLTEVNEEGKPLLQRVAETVPATELSEALKQVRQTVIEKLIERKIMLQEAEKNKISVTDEEVERAYERILERNNMTPESFREQLATLGMNETQYRENLQTQVLSSKLVNLEIRSKVIIPENRIIDYYDANYTERVEEGGYYILQIGIKWDEKAAEGSGIPRTREAAREKAEQIRNLAVNGGDFRKLARDHSNLPSAVDGGDIGILDEDDMPSNMLEAITGTRPGGITPIIDTSSGYQFFKVLSSQEGQIITKVPYESVKDEIYDILYQQEMEARYEKWLKEVKSKAYIKIL